MAARRGMDLVRCFFLILASSPRQLWDPSPHDAVDQVGLQLRLWRIRVPASRERAVAIQAQRTAHASQARKFKGSIHVIS